MKARCLFFEAVFLRLFFNDVTLIPNLVTIAIVMNKRGVLHAPDDVFISSFNPIDRLSNRRTHSALNIVLSFLA